MIFLRRNSESIIFILECDEEQYTCGNGECISESLPCNGQCIGGRWPKYVRAQSQEGLFSLKL